MWWYICLGTRPWNGHTGPLPPYVSSAPTPPVSFFLFIYSTRAWSVQGPVSLNSGVATCHHSGEPVWHCSLSKQVHFSSLKADRCSVYVGCSIYVCFVLEFVYTRKLVRIDWHHNSLQMKKKLGWLIHNILMRVNTEIPVWLHTVKACIVNREVSEAHKLLGHEEVADL